MRIFPTLTALCTAGALALAGVPWLLKTQSRVDLAATRVQKLRTELLEMREMLRDRETAFNEVHTAQEALAQDYVALEAAHSSLVNEAAGLRDRTAKLDRERDSAQMLLSKIEELETELETEREQLESRIASESERLQLDLAGVRAAQADFEARTAAAPDPTSSAVAALREQVLGPVFQLSGGEAVGSAVLVGYVDDEDDPHYLALSCYHVVRDILEGRDDFNSYREVSFRAVFTGLDACEDAYPARMIEWDIESDLALLKVETSAELGPVARIAPLERTEEIGVFREIYTVGCPLGTAAQATRGMITRETWEVAGEPYWMVSSPAFFGNSGGGVFHAETLELVGIFAKIYTHGSYRPQVITHMGLAVPLTRLHSWLTEIGHAELLPKP
ncbi:MAG: trypsin-like peptidase domain-containing protein [Planctomycetes bacterium]|nr:trypsin-like peptidase domain-containing protein [Planctomycetota bacterium]